MGDLQIISTPQSLNGPLETWFIQNILFSGAPYALGFDSMKISSEVVVYLECGSIDYEVLKQIRMAGKRIILYQMGDELGQADLSRYREFDFVIRNYYRSDVFENVAFDNKVIWVPNGFRTGVGPRARAHIKSAGQRQGFAAFLGWISNPNSYKNERIDFAKAALACGDQLYVLPARNFAGGYNVGLYSAIMEDNIFAPCPSGNSPETIRLYDVLELGCIPIMLKHEFLFSNKALAAIGPVPFVFLDSWSELPDFFKKVKETFPQDLEKWRKQQLLCIGWWSNYKTYISGVILEAICRIH